MFLRFAFFRFINAFFKGKELCFGRDERNVPMEGEQCAGISELIQLGFEMR